MKPLEMFNKVLSAYKEEDIKNILSDLSKQHIAWRPVGDRKNNEGTIHAQQDPASALTEKITNAIDAVIQRAWIEQGKPQHIQSPRQAAKELFGIPNGHLANIADLQDERWAKLSKLITISLYDSGTKEEPTIEIRDQGVGIESERIPKTILSLNEGNKVESLHLLGTYGQGGSAALAFSEYTIIISKSMHRPNKAAFTIIRYKLPDAASKNGYYEYMVDKSSRHPWEVAVDENAFSPGTLIRHIKMDIRQCQGNILASTNSLRYITHHYLFDPVLPFTIQEKRTGKRAVKGRVMGNNAILTQKKNLDHYQSTTLKFKQGSLQIYYWVLNTTTEDQTNKIQHYTTKPNPFLITFNGQKQGMLTSADVRDLLKLPYLEGSLIVQVDASKVDPQSRRKLFTSTREALKDNSTLARELVKNTVQILKLDKKLKQLDQARKQRYATKDTLEVQARIAKRLNKRCQVFLQKVGSAAGSPKTAIEPSDSDEKKPPIPVQDRPSLLEAMGTSPRQVIIGKEKFFVRFKTDAHPKHFNTTDIFNQAKFSASVKPRTLASFIGRTDIQDGYGKAYFALHKHAIVGDQGDITFTLELTNQKALTATVTFEVVERPIETNPEGEGNKRRPNIKASFVGKGDPFYRQQSWNKKSVAKLEEDEDEIVVYVNAENENLQKLMSQTTRRGAKAMEDVRNMYLENISFYAFISNISKKTEDFRAQDIPPEIVDFMGGLGLNHTSETMCGALQSFSDTMRKVFHEQAED